LGWETIDGTRIYYGETDGVGLWFLQRGFEIFAPEPSDESKPPETGIWTARQLLGDIHFEYGLNVTLECYKSKCESAFVNTLQQQIQLDGWYSRIDENNWISAIDN